MIINIRVTDVAILIGKNKFSTPAEILNIERWYARIESRINKFDKLPKIRPTSKHGSYKDLKADIDRQVHTFLSQAHKLTTPPPANSPENSDPEFDCMDPTYIPESDIKDISAKFTQMTWGIMNESKTLTEAKCSTDKVPMKEYVIATINGNTYTIRGMCDSIDQEKVVEIKNRVNPYHRVYEHEIIQVICYMKIFDRAQGLLIEDFQGKLTKHNIEIGDWDKILEPLLVACHRIDKLIQDSKTPASTCTSLEQ